MLSRTWFNWIKHLLLRRCTSTPCRRWKDSRSVPPSNEWAVKLHSICWFLQLDYGAVKANASEILIKHWSAAPSKADSICAVTRCFAKSFRQSEVLSVIRPTTKCCERRSGSHQSEMRSFLRLVLFSPTKDFITTVIETFIIELFNFPGH